MKQGVVIAYDNRMFSAHFAEETALVLARGGIPVYLFDRMRPTPMMSFAVRELKAAAGVSITASHKEAKYNGVKMFGENGAHISQKTAIALTRSMERVNDELLVEAMRLQQAMRKGYLTYIGEELEEGYYRQLETVIQDATLLPSAGDKLSIVYTPLHGSGGIPVREALRRAGFKHVHRVEAQEKPDPYFTTIAEPNPEETEVMSMALAAAKQSRADVVLGTDADVSSTGVTIRTRQGSYVQLTGNELGALLLHYMLLQKQKKRQLPADSILLKSIVTSELGSRIAEQYGVNTIRTLLGFKYIAEKVFEYEQSGTATFLFGYEESHGYLAGAFVRDRDGIQACQLICEMSAYYKSKDRTLDEVLEELQVRHGYHQESRLAYNWNGREGNSRMKRIMRQLRKQPLPRLEGYPVACVHDYLSSVTHYEDGASDSLDMPRADVIKAELRDGSWFAICPSATEPKLTAYIGVTASTRVDCESKHESVRLAVQSWLKQTFEEAEHQRKRRKNKR